MKLKVISAIRRLEGSDGDRVFVGPEDKEFLLEFGDHLLRHQLMILIRLD
jgi:hypothetical protein